MQATTFAPQQSMGFAGHGYQQQQAPQPVARRPLPQAPVAPSPTVTLSKETIELLTKAAHVIYLKCNHMLQKEMDYNSELYSRGEAHQCSVNSLVVETRTAANTPQRKVIIIRPGQFSKNTDSSNLDPYKLKAFECLRALLVQEIETAFKNNYKACALLLMPEENFSEMWVKDKDSTHQALFNAKFLQSEVATVVQKLKSPQ
ncbi:MAG: hypothetical protein LLF94_07115 [Chlamydiales bacterium]|nr:hypothetical protein [Chlamydiales bacterium]